MILSENKMSDIIKASLDGMRAFSDMDTAIGKAIVTPSGVTVIPVSRVSMGIATGGIDYGDKKALPLQNFGGGGGSGLSITPIAFLTVGCNSEIDLIEINPADSDINRLLTLIERSPEIVEKIKQSFL